MKCIIQQLLVLHMGMQCIHVLLQQTLASRQPPFFFAMIFVSQQIQRPTFIYIYIYMPRQCSSPGAYSVSCPSPRKGHQLSKPQYLCCSSQHLWYTSEPVPCTGIHTQLVDYEHIILLNTATTPTGKVVSTLAEFSKATNNQQTAYRLRDTYHDQVETYKQIRSRLYGPYTM